MTARALPFVLVVEGSGTIREILQRRPGEHGYRVAGAPDGEAALEQVGAHPPDAILLDHELTGMSAMELLDRLRADDGLAAIPVIVLSHGTDREPLLEALRRGANDHLRQPFDPAELDARVLAALRVKAHHDSLLEANRRLAEQALTDELTGLANRRHGVNELVRAVALATRHEHVLAIARVDVDHFKEINDTHGHQAGDQVLAEVAHRLARSVRGGDALARWGGDEFVAILPDTERAGALRAAVRMRAAVAAAAVGIGDAEVAVTISVGWAHWSGETADELLVRADRALYQAKDAGRDTVRPLE